MNRPTLTVTEAPRWPLRRWRRWLNASLAGASVALVGGCVSSNPRFKAEADQSLTVPATANALRIDNGVGEVEVIGIDGATEVRAEILKRGKGRTPQEAEEALAEIIVTLAPDPRSPGTLLGSVDHPRHTGLSWRGNPKQYEVEWRITAPSGMALQVVGDVGDLTVRNFRSGARLKTDVGEIRAEDVFGGLAAQTDVGDVTASASGAIDVRTDVGDIVITALPGEPGSVTIAGDVGTVSLTLPDSWEGEVFASTDVGSLERGLDSFRSDGRQSRSTMRGVVGSGSPGRVNITTDVGDVQVRQGALPVRDHAPERPAPRGQPL